MGLNDTADITNLSGGVQVIAPAIVLLESREEPRCTVRFFEHALVVGREPACDFAIDDDGLSKRHFRVERALEGWRVEDLGSSNGTYVNGAPIATPVIVADEAIIRAGRSVFLLEWHASRFASGAVVEVIDGRVRGPAMRAVEREIEKAAARPVSLLIAGETGTGKEAAARLFHEAGPNSRGPFTVVNCADLRGDTVTARLFGAKKGSHSMADRDKPGAFDDANGGSLYLDEIHQLAIDTQPLLLRAVETKRIAPLGTTVTHAVDVQICTGTNVDLRDRIADGRFAADLFYRLRQTEVRLPPLRKRREEIAYLVRLVLAQESLQHLRVRHEFIEACLLRTWPGNVREFVAAMRAAAHRAHDTGSPRLEPKHLEAGEIAAPKPNVAPAVVTNPALEALPKHKQVSIQLFGVALERNGGSVKAAAEEVGIEISTAYEWRDLLAGKPRRRR